MFTIELENNQRTCAPVLLPCSINDMHSKGHLLWLGAIVTVQMGNSDNERTDDLCPSQRHIRVWSQFNQHSSNRTCYLWYVSNFFICWHIRFVLLSLFLLIWLWMFVQWRNDLRSSVLKLGISSVWESWRIFYWNINCVVDGGSVEVAIDQITVFIFGLFSLIFLSDWNRSACPRSGGFGCVPDSLPRLCYHLQQIPNNEWITWNAQPQNNYFLIIAYNAPIEDYTIFVSTVNSTQFLII